MNSNGEKFRKMVFDYGALILGVFGTAYAVWQLIGGQGTRISLVEAKTESMQNTIQEMRTDIKDLLKLTGELPMIRERVLNIERQVYFGIEKGQN